MKRCMLLTALFAFAGAAFADTTDWFDAKIKNLDDWPDYTTEGIAGGWTGASAATLQGTVDVDQYLSLTDATTPLVFTAEQSKSLATYAPIVTSSITFTAYDIDDKPEIPSDAKGGVIVCEDSNSALTYWGIAKSGDANAWVQLDGTPDLTQPVEVTIRVDGGSVTYSFGGAAQTREIVIAGDAPAVSKASYQGVGSVHSLSAVTAPVEKTLTIGAGLAADNLQVVSVDGATKINDTTWKFPVGTDLTVTFGPVDGAYMWRSGNTKIYSAQSDDFTIAARPDGVDKAYAGSSDDPILIQSYADFLKLKTEVASSDFEGKYFKQVGNINFADQGVWDGIGSETAYFKGTYDGDDYELQNIRFAKAKYQGVFKVFGGTIKNLTVHMIGFDEADTTTASYGAALVGQSRVGATFNHVITTGSLLNATHNTAGFAVQGHVGTYVGCTNRCAISVVNRDRAAGFVSFSQNGGASACTSTFTDCANEAAISADDGAESGAYGVVGFVALMGEAHSCTFTRCVNTGTLTCGNTEGYLADFVGQLGTGAGGTLTIVDCVAGNYKSVGHIGVGTVKVNDGSFAKDDGSGQYVYCATPTAVGSYKVMMDNAETITLTGAQKGETLTLDQSLATYTGEVTCDNAGLEATQEGNVWTVGLKTFKITYVYKDASEQTLTDVSNTNPTTFTIESGTITFDNTKVSKTGYTCGDEAFNPASIDCANTTQDVEVTVTLVATSTGTAFTITATGCTTLTVDDVVVTSPFVTAAKSAGDTIKVEVAYSSDIKLPVKKIVISGGTSIDLDPNPFTYTVTGSETSPTIVVTVEDASQSDEVQPKDVVPPGTSAENKVAAQANITTLAQKSGKTDTTLLKSIAGWVGGKSISGDDIAAATEDDLEAAYLLNCGDLEEATIEAAKAAFKFPSITPGTKPTVTTPDGYHGTLTTWGNAGLDDDGWVDLKDKTDISTYKFFKAELTK